MKGVLTKMTKSLSEFWNSEVSKERKHFIDLLDEDMINRTLGRCHNYFLKYVDLDDIDIAMDWGCGGGLIAKELGRKCDVVLIDVSKESLRTAQCNVENVVHAQLVPDDIGSFVYEGPKLDLILSNAVLHHFPSYEYCLKVLDIWKSIGPKFIAAQIKEKDKIEFYQNPDDYFEGTNYTIGLYMPKEQFEKDLADRGYKCIAYNTETTPANQKMGYFVFDRE
jgi:2-polyprenyl-3-methyl-5-hydroxy-6-metoxy-1,4-benzoquinol methylase